MLMELDCFYKVFEPDLQSRDYKIFEIVTIVDQHPLYQR